MLRGNNDGMNPLRYATIFVFQRKLALRIGTQVLHKLSLLANFRQLHHRDVGQFNRERHIVVRLTRRVAEHHALIASPLLNGRLSGNPAKDIGGLLLNGRKNPTATTVKHILSLAVAQPIDYIPRNMLHIHVALSPYLSA